jgi:uncharacterized protein (DUF58 family)
MGRRVEGEWWAIAAGLALAGAGWWVHSTLLALAGVLGAVTALVLFIWQRESLTAVTYRRTLSQHRAIFGEEVSLELEIVNDKVLPLTWLHVADDVPTGLTITGGTVLTDPHARLHHLLPMLPFQRVRRRVSMICDRRGEHVFGPARLRSGNPMGYRSELTTLRDLDRLLVYPKLFRLGYPRLASRVPLGDQRARQQLMGDPSRPVGVRAYRAGDPIRHVDWRATARGSALLVRVFEPTAALRVAVFGDTHLSRRVRTAEASDVNDIVEFTIAVTASIVSDLAGRRVATGLHSTGRVDGDNVAIPPSSSPTALPAMLELLARCAPWGGSSIAKLLVTEAAGLRRGASVVLVSAHFPEATVAAVADLRRRLPVTVVWVANEHGLAPPPGLADASWEVTYSADWKQRDVLELAE